MQRKKILASDSSKIGLELAYSSGSESSVKRLMTSPSGAIELALDDGTPELRDSFDRLCSRSCGVTTPGTGGASSGRSPLLFFFLRRRRELMSLEKPLEPAFAESGASPPWVFGRSLESIEERPLLRPELSIVSDSAETVQARRDLLPLPLRLEDSESMLS